MFAPIHAIESACRQNVPALKNILLVDPYDLQVQPSWWLLPNFESLQFKESRGALELGHNLLSGRLVERATDTPQGELYELALSAEVRNVRLEVEYLRAKLRNRRIHVVATYRNGLQRFIPNMRLLATGDSGDRSNKNGYQFQGTARMFRPAPFVDSPPPVITGIVIPPAVNPPSEGGSVSVTQVTTTSPSYVFTLPVGKLLLCVFIKSTAGQTVNIGTTAGDYDLTGPVEITAGQWAILGDNIWHADTATPIYISGLAGTNTLKFYVI